MRPGGANRDNGDEVINDGGYGEPKALEVIGYPGGR